MRKKDSFSGSPLEYLTENCVLRPPVREQDNFLNSIAPTPPHTLTPIAEACDDTSVALEADGTTLDDATSSPDVATNVSSTPEPASRATRAPPSRCVRAPPPRPTPCRWHRLRRSSGESSPTKELGANQATHEHVPNAAEATPLVRKS